MDKDTQLPAEVVEEIKELQDKLTSIIILDDSFNKGYYSGMRTGIEAGATEYATKLHQAEQDFERVQRTAINYANRKRELERQRDALQAKCERYKTLLEKSNMALMLKGYAGKLLNEINEALSAGEGQKEVENGTA
jgi:hypothetical protein